MAVYETEGFCPNNDFAQFFTDESNKMTRVRQETLDILGRRTAYMVYPKNKYAWRKGPCSIVDAMLGGDGLLGMELAVLLKALVPTVDDDAPLEKRPKFVIADHVNPHDICDDLCFFADVDHGKWAFFVEDRAYPDNPVTYLNGKTVMNDDRYLVVANDWEAQKEQPTVYIDLFRLCE